MPELRPAKHTRKPSPSVRFKLIARWPKPRVQRRLILCRPINANLAVPYLMKGNINAAIEQCQKTIELDPNFWQPQALLAMAYWKEGRSSESLPEAQKASELAGRMSMPLGSLGFTYAAMGKRAEALAILKELEGRYAKREALGQFLAAMYAEDWARRIRLSLG